MRRFLPLLAGLVLLALPSAAQAYTFYEYDAGGTPGAITELGGSLVFTYSTDEDSRIGKSTPLGVLSAPSAPIAGATAPTTIVPGPGDGSVWFIHGTKVGRMGATQAPSEFAHDFGATPRDLVAADNGTMWILKANANLECATATGGDFFVKDSKLTSPVAITRSRDGAVWYVDSTANKLA